MGKENNTCDDTYQVIADRNLEFFLRSTCPRCDSRTNCRNARIRFNEELNRIEIFQVGEADICQACGFVRSYR